MRICCNRQRSGHGTDEPDCYPPIGPLTTYLARVHDEHMTDQDQAEISISDATRRYGVSRTTLLYAIDHQKIRARLVPVGRAKHRYLMSLPDLERWLADEHLPRPRRGG